MSNISAATGIASNSAAQQNLLKQAQAAMTAKKYQDAAKYLWWILGSPGTMPQAYTAQQVAAAAAAVSKNSNAPAAVKAAVASAVVAQQQQAATPQQTASATVVAGINKVYEGLHAGNVNRDAVQYNLNLLRTKGGLSSAQNNLLSKAYQQTGAGNYQGAAETIWVLMGSPASRTPHVAQATANYNAAKTALSASQVIDPQKMAGYTFKYSLSHAEQNAYLNAKARNTELTEYEWRKANGKDLATATGKYTAPKYTYSSEKSQKNTASVGSGDKKIENSKKSVGSAAVAKNNPKNVLLKIVDRKKKIQLKDGTWINKVEVVGKKDNVKLYASKSEYNAVKAAQKKAAKEAAKLKQAYKVVLSQDGKIIDAVQTKNSSGVGESGVKVIKRDKSGKITAMSGTAKEYKQLEKLAKNASIPITSNMAAADKKEILRAREYILARMSGNAKTMQAVAYASKDNGGNLGANRAETRFKSVDQLTNEKLQKSSNKVVSSLAKLNAKHNEALNYGKVTKEASAKLNAVDKAVATVVSLPKLSSIEKSRNEFLKGINVKVTQPGKATREYTAFDVQQKGQKAIYDNTYSKAIFDYTAETYDGVRTKPVTSVAKVAAIYAGGVVAGVVIEGALGAASLGAAKVAVKASSPLVKNVAASASRKIPTAGRALMGAQLANEGYKTAKEGDATQIMNFVGSLAVGGYGYSKGAGILKDPISIIPGVRTVKLQEVSAGHSTSVKDMRIGETFSLRGKDIVSRTREGNFVKGPAYTTSISKGKVVQSFDARNNAAFLRTVEALSKVDAKLFRAGKSIADTAYEQQRAVTTPKSFDILSEHISAEMKPVVKATILSYTKLKTQSIEVYGSVAQKLQMQGYLSRKPQDLEISVSNVGKFVEKFKTNAKKDGFTEGKDYRINAAEADAPKIEFKINGKWVKGIEVFSKDSKLEEIPGYRSEAGIAFGYGKMKPINVESAKMMKLQEQAARKFAGATSLQDGVIKPVHEGRLKDVKDLIEIGTANEIVNKTKISEDIIQFAKLYSKKNAEVLKSPIANYITKRSRIPVNKGAKALASDKFEAVESFLTAKRTENAKTSRTLRESKLKNKSYSRVKSKQRKGSEVVSKVVEKPVKKTTLKKEFRRSKQTKTMSEREVLFESKKAVDSIKAVGNVKAFVSELGRKQSSKAIQSKRVSDTHGNAVSKAKKSSKRVVTAGTPIKSKSLRKGNIKDTSGVPVISKSKSVKPDSKSVAPVKQKSSGIVSKSKSAPDLSKVKPEPSTPSRPTPSKSAQIPSKPSSSASTPSRQSQSLSPSPYTPPVSEGTGAKKIVPMKIKKITPVEVTRKKKRKEVNIKKKLNVNLFARKLKNKLGSLESMFGSIEPERKAPKRKSSRRNPNKVRAIGSL